jgi:UDP-N-acetylmuramoylalanine--D-glutamate ligase
MRIAIIGFGIQGKSSYDYWRNGNQITICDEQEVDSPPKGVELRIGRDYLKNLDEFDLIVRTPKLNPRDIAVANTDAILAKVTSNTNEFFRVCPSKNIIGVTGTKGKGTTSTLISEMLKATGKRVFLGGNIGTPPLDLLRDGISSNDFVVLELANFQLIDLSYSPHIAVCLMIAPEHLDWHEGLEEYISSKKMLFAHQTETDIAIYYADNDKSKEIVSVSPGVKIPFYHAPGAAVIDDKIMIDDQEIVRTKELQLLGKHNWQNVCAAITVLWQIYKEPEILRNVILGYKGLPHRLELVKEVNGVKFYNDSFASAPDAAMAAIEAIDKPKVMIIGGFDRNLPLENLAQKIKDNEPTIQKIVLIGASAERVAENLDKIGFSNYLIETSKDINEIVINACHIAKEGDVVVLSPGFPSFDMFKNFEVRGLLYKDAVNAL